jgi:hypothetical protein
MTFDLATAPEMQAARIFSGAVMVAFLTARMFRHQAQRVRVVVAGLYIVGVLGFMMYVLF